MSETITIYNPGLSALEAGDRLPMYHNGELTVFIIEAVVWVDNRVQYIVRQAPAPGCPDNPKVV